MTLEFDWKSETTIRSLTSSMPVTSRLGSTKNENRFLSEFFFIISLHEKFHQTHKILTQALVVCLSESYVFFYFILERNNFMGNKWADDEQMKKDALTNSQIWIAYKKISTIIA